MATQHDSNELRVERNADIEEDLKRGYNIDLATATFEADEIEKALNGAGTQSSGGDGAVSGVKVDFKDGKATNIVQRMVPITQTNTMETPAADLDDKKKAQIKAKAEKSKAMKEKEAKDRDGIGE